MALAGPAAAADGAALCRAAGEAAERAHEVPAGLLLAIGRVESGRWDGPTGQVSAWPWTTNAAGVGRHYDSVGDALVATRAVQSQGVQSVDVGCFQVNLLHHPGAFASLEDAFDPTINAAYAARFLVGLRARTGSWEAAVGAYHSQTPERGGPYRDRVLAGWARDGGPAAPHLPAVPAATVPFVWQPAAAQSGIRVWTPSAPGAAPMVIQVRSGPAPASPSSLPTVRVGKPQRILVGMNAP